MELNLIDCCLVRGHDDLVRAESDCLYTYLIAGNGLWVHAEDDRMSATIPVAPADCPGLTILRPEVRLKLDRIPSAYLITALQSARRRLPDEAIYQFAVDPKDDLWPWRCICPPQKADVSSVTYANDARAVVDLHSHGNMAAYFSDTDSRDEGGLRFYAVVGNILVEPILRVRVGVYGHHFEISPLVVFDGWGPFKGIDL